MSQSLCFNDFIFSPITRDNQPWFRSSEIATALGYAREDTLSRLYDRNADEFTSEMTQVVEISVDRQFGVEGRARIFSLRGCHLLAMFARTPVAKAFRKWVLDVIEQYGDRVPVAEPVTLNDELISASERAELKLIVDAKLSTYPAAVQGKARAEIWAKFNRHFRIAEYKQLPARLMPDAREFLLSVRVRAINAIPTAESAIPVPALPASNIYRDRVKELERLEVKFMEFAGETRTRLSELNAEYIRLNQGAYAAMLGLIPSIQPGSKDRLIDALSSQSYDAYNWIDEGLQRMRLAIIAARSANRAIAEAN
ncbi:BRO family protein [uncultured Bilophila sp.]|uniref:BRO-N domain-containing protein n=1 Tax=uncultured Bilophila sp. TaxID=529385 RepID=UPI00280B7D45|nr:BRO family protein [uncultured Bilophila sp.]